jgi:hypothetical protein
MHLIVVSPIYSVYNSIVSAGWERVLAFYLSGVHWR